MALKNKKINFPKVSKIHFDLKRFTGIDEITDTYLTEVNKAKECLNFDTADGALKNSCGFNYSKLPLFNQEEILYTMPSFSGKTIQQIFQYKKYNYDLDKPEDQLIVLCDNVLYKIPLYGLTYQATQIAVDFYERATACNYTYNGKDVLLISSIVNGFFIYDGANLTQVQNTPPIKSVILHNERVFALVSGYPYSIWFSDDFNPQNWNISLTEAGFINMPDGLGEVRKIISMPDAIYIFRDYGISKLNAIGDQKDFILSQFYISGSRIYDRTIASDNNRIVFTTEKAVLECDGSSIREICLEISNTVKGLNTKYSDCAINEGKYYLAARSRAIDGSTMSGAQEDYNDTLLIVSLTDGSIEKIYDVDIKSMLSVSVKHFNTVLVSMRGTQKGFLYNIDKTGKLLNSPFVKKWISPVYDFGIRSKKKTLTNFSIYSDSDIKIRFNLDGYEVLYIIKGGCRSQLNINKTFFQMSFVIICETAECNILPPYMVIEINGD